MQGLTEAEISKLCNQKGNSGFSAAPYWTAEIYGFGRLIREYGSYPAFLPLCISTDHGPSTLDFPLKQELETTAPCQFYHSPRLVSAWKKVSNKPCYPLYSPFVFYRRKYNINVSPEARGAIAFPAHTTHSIEDVSDIEAYIKQLLELPPEFQPVSVCLHYEDMKKKKYKIFQEYKIPVYTAGYYFDQRFTERFYNILRNFKYATSNIPGSYLFYSVEMGIPFSLYGEKQKYVNKGDPNLPLGEFDPYKTSNLYKEAHRLFEGLNTKITPEQYSFVENSLGLKDGVDRPHMRHILYTSFVRWLFSEAPFLWMCKIIEVVFKLTRQKLWRASRQGVR